MLDHSGYEEYSSRVCDMTPDEFEKYCCKMMKAYAEGEGLQDFKIQHNVIIEADDGDYQIDIYATFKAIGMDMKILGECKRYQRKVEREKVAALADKLHSTGAQKGILFSTSGFQSGAIRYAKKHGIALVQVFDTKTNWYAYDADPEGKCDDDDPFKYCENHLPRYHSYVISEEKYLQKRVYPTDTMFDKVYYEMLEQIDKCYGLNVKNRIGGYHILEHLLGELFTTKK